MASSHIDRKNFIAWIVFTFIAGLALGIWSTDYFMSRKAAEAFGVALTDEMLLHERLAVRAFKEFDAATSNAIQETLIDTAVKRHKLGWLSEKDLNRISGLARARIAVASLEIGSTGDANKQLEQAIVELKRADLPATKESLLGTLSKERPPRK